jgi:tRNA A37 threonylcarbamoyladenosine modification protein TsaB
MSDGLLVGTDLHLGIDTSTGVSVGVARGRTVLASRTVDLPHVHAERLMPEVRACLDEAGHPLDHLAGIVVGLGPGPFTGLRVASSPPRRSRTLDVPLKGSVPSMVDWPPTPPRALRRLFDARRKGLYWASRVGRRTSGPFVTSPDQLPDLPVHGPGADRYPLVHRGRPAPDGPRLLDAGLMAAHHRELPDAGTEPLYLRQADATVPGARKSALPPPRPGRSA